jgi:hypothetical protein
MCGHYGYFGSRSQEIEILGNTAGGTVRMPGNFTSVIPSRSISVARSNRRTAALSGAMAGNTVVLLKLGKPEVVDVVGLQRNRFVHGARFGARRRRAGRITASFLAATASWLAASLHTHQEPKAPQPRGPQIVCSSSGYEWSSTVAYRTPGFRWPG